MCICVSMCMYVYVYVYISVHYYKLVIKYHQLALQVSSHIGLQLHSHQKSKQTNKQTKTTTKQVFTVVGSGTRSVLLVSQSKNDCIEILKTVTLVIN